MSRAYSKLGGILDIDGDGTVFADNNAMLNSYDVAVGSAPSLKPNAELDMSSGATGTAQRLAVGLGATGTFIMEREASYTVTKLAYIGADRPGTLELSGGSSITFQAGVHIANFSKATVDLDASKMTVPIGQDFIVGVAAPASFTVENGATLTTDGGRVGATKNAAGTVMTIDGTIWDAGGQQVAEGQGSRVDFQNGGSIKGKVLRGVQVPAANVPPAQLAGIDSVDGDVEDPGIVEPGNDPTTGTLTVTGTYLQDSTAALEIGIASATSYDALADGGTATLDGTLAVSDIGAPDFEPGQRYNILTSSGVVGNFANFVPTGTDGGIRYIDVPGGGYLPLLPSGLEWEVEYTSSGVTLVVVPSVSIKSDGDVYETDQSPGKFTVTRTGPTTNSLTVSYTVGGTASQTDYNGAGGTVTIPIGAKSAPIEITPIDDGDVDDNEPPPTLTLTVKRQTGVYIVGSPSSDTVTIDEESPPTVTIAATTPTTLETSGTPGAFTVSRTGPTDDALTVSYSTSGSASAGTDYTALGGSVTIPVGQSSAAINVSPLDDGDGDDTTASATVTATLASSAGYTIGSANSATVTIDEDILPTVTISATTPTTAEVGGSGTFTVSLSAAAPNNITVSYSTSGTAVAGTDYQALSGSVLVPAGQTSATITVSPLDDGDGDDNGGSASVTATLQNSSSYIVGGANAATVSITEDVSAPTATISASNPTTTEGGPSPGAFTVSLSSAPTSNVTVNYSLSGTATNGTDYQTLSGQVVISAGQTSATIQVTPIDDGDGDDSLQSEAVTATLTSGSGYTVGSPNAATVTIDEEGGGSGPSVSINAQSSSMAESGGVGDQLDLVLTSPPATSIVVHYSLSGTTQNGVDYQTLSGSVTVPAGQTHVQIPVTPIDDGDGDDNQTSESLTATLIGGSGYSIGSPASTTITIYEESQGGPPQILDLPPKTADATAATIDANDAWAIVPAAAARWIAAGVAPITVIGDLLGLRITVDDLPDSALGEANASTRQIWLDTNAAGYGWFVDRTPWSDGEFDDIVAPTELEATGGSPAVGHADLLTVLMHEMGHLFGLPEAAGSESVHDVMWETLGLSTRRLPDGADALAASAAPSAAIDSQARGVPVDAIFERLGAGASDLPEVAALPAWDRRMIAFN